MPVAPSFGQLALVFASTLLFIVSVGLSVTRKDRRGLSMGMAMIGVALAVSVIVWHAAVRKSWLPLEDNFDALLWLAVLTACFSLYLQQRRAIGRIDWVASPIVILLLIAAAVFGKTLPQPYTHGLWAWTHRLSVYTGPIFFALAASAGVMYLVLSNRLRNKHLPVDARFGSLERLERLTYTAVQVGFALLTIGMVTGIVWAMREPERLGSHWFYQPKIILAVSAYVLYALVLHSPINPAFRGRRTAMLSIAGFVLLLGTIVVVQAMGNG
jgi:ABC-type transport system involved in cytochrome c biogenesis permease subunit